MNPPLYPARLLVVDDDPVVSLLVCHELSAAGFRPTVAATAAAARERLASEPFDLVLLDVGLPDEDGYDLCRDLKSRPELKELPIVFMTARGSEPEVLRGFDVGGVDYVVKPFDPQVLLARVTTHATLARLSRDLQSALDERTESLQIAHRRMRELDSEMALAEERERRRLAGQLHDTTIQQLVLARILLDRAGEGGTAPVAERLADLLDSSLAQLRSLVFELSPPVLYRAGLFAALQWLAAQLGERWGLSFACRLEGEPENLTDDLKVTLFQGARELMTNVGRHAGAASCEVVLSFEGAVVRLVVRDDGVGIDPVVAAGGCRAGRDGFGLFSLRSRIELLGGGLDLRAGGRGGTRAVLWVPLSQGEAGSGAATRPRSLGQRET